MSKQVEVILDYGTHQYTRIMKPVDQHCPACGNDTVWQETDSGCYYLGSSCVCLDCSAEFYEVAWTSLAGDIVSQIRDAIDE